MAQRAAIFGVSGPDLTPDERAFFRGADPWGFILFARNIASPEQVRRLVSDLRQGVGRDAPVLIDQEGGRVARMTPPAWTGWDNAFDFVQRCRPQDRAEAMRLRYAIIGAELVDLGIDVNCAPLADVARPDMHPSLRERCYGADTGKVADLARAVATGLGQAGVLPVPVSYTHLTLPTTSRV